MKFTKEQRQQYINNFTTNFDKRVLETNIISCEEINSPTFIGVKLMTKKKEAPIYFVEFANEVREFMKMQMEFNKKIISRLDNIENDIIAIKSCPTIKKELDK